MGLVEPAQPRDGGFARPCLMLRFDGEAAVDLRADLAASSRVRQSND
jgi:hypothetical protein